MRRRPTAAAAAVAAAFFVAAAGCLASAAAAAAAAGPYDTDTYAMDVRSCEPVHIEMCKGLGYNQTAGPNFVGHDNQRDTELQLRTFTSLVQIGCSDQLLPFLCAVYVPMCSPKVEQLIGPCRQVCDSVQARCAPVLLSFGLPWPAALNCSKFPPVNQEGSMCMDIPTGDWPPPPQPPTSAGPAGSRLTGSRRPSSAPLPRQPGGGRRPADQSAAQTAVVAAAATPGEEAAATLHPCSRYRNPTAYMHVNRTNECLPLCNADNAFTHESKEFARVWIAAWSTLCFVASSLAVAAFFLDARRFRFPERPLAFLSLCAAMQSVGYAVRLVAGGEAIVCDAARRAVLLHRDGLDNANCAAVFLLLYYFGAAGSLWWVALNVCYFLAAGLRWSHEAIEVYSSYLHLVAWAVPAVQSIAVIVLRDVAGDELTGLCFVDVTRSREAALALVVLPSAACLLLGLGFLVAGFVAASCGTGERRDRRFPSLLGRRRRPADAACSASTPLSSDAAAAAPAAGILNAAAGGTKPSTTTAATAVAGRRRVSMAARVGISSAIYSVPAACLLACHLYEYAHRASWYEAAPPGDGSGGGGVSQESAPRVEIVTLRIFASLATGLVSSLCVLSGQSLRSWSALCRRARAGGCCCDGGDDRRTSATAGGMRKPTRLMAQQLQQQQQPPLLPAVAYHPVKLAQHAACTVPPTSPIASAGLPPLSSAAQQQQHHRVLLMYDNGNALAR